MGTWSKRALVGLLGLAPGCAAPASPPAVDAPPAHAAAPGHDAAARTRARLGALGVHAVSVDEHGTPRLLRAARGARPSAWRGEAAARAHVAELAPALAVGADALATLRTVRARARADGGELVVLRHRLDDVDVYREDVRVLVRADGSLAAVAGAPRADATPRPGARWRRGAPEVLAIALRDHAGVAAVPTLVSTTGDDARVAAGAALDEPAWVRRVWLREAGALVSAWRVEFYAADGAARRYLIADGDGAVLGREDLTTDAFAYRGWFEPGTGRPLDGPLADITPHPIGAPGPLGTPYVGTTLVSTDGYNTNPDGAVDPWLAPGATETRGNNADVYADATSPDGFGDGDVRGAVSSPGAFDHAYDPLAEPIAAAQTQASATSLFYVINWLHDWYYDAGFDEAAGNGQLDNYGRGGLAGDPIKGEVQDAYAAGSRNNANMATPSDGATPRMQVYVWSGPTTTGLTLEPGGGTPPVGVAAFGPVDFDVTGDVVLVDDGVAPAGDGCAPLVGDVTGKIVLIDRGTCTFKLKAVHAEAAGALGVIIANDRADGAAMAMGAGDPPGDVATPLLSIGTADGVALKAALLAGPTTARLLRDTGTERDGSFDQTVIAHEFGHFLHHRLADCSSRQCRAISEGLGDFLALHLSLREGDDLAGAYPVAQYATASYPDAEYFGIRRAPYSITPTRNAFTLGDIAADAELPTTAPLSPRTGTDPTAVHAAGEIWASMLHEGYVALLATTAGPDATRTFEAVRRQMSEYLVTALGLLPVDATYLETRDALLAAAGAVDEADASILAEAFARRGAGTCAVAPARASIDFAGITESFVVTPRVQVLGAELTLAPDACDADDLLDAGEAGTLTFTLGNGGPIAAVGATLVVTSSTVDVAVDGGTFALPTLAPYATTTVEVPVVAGPSLPPGGQLEVSATITDAAACEPEVTVIDARPLDVDAVAGLRDDVETPTTAWRVAGGGGTGVWARAEVTPGQHAWRGTSLAQTTDTWLETPPLTVAAAGGLAVTFAYRHDLEVDAEGVAYDGVVVEVSTDAGASWVDARGLGGGEPYPGTIGADTSGALAGRPAFVGRNAAWPARDTLTVALGGVAGGATARVRWRLATDGGVGSFGWELDDVEVEGVDGAPFTALVPEPGGCPPRAVAGADLEAVAGDEVVLDATASTDPDDVDLGYAWTQVIGAPVALASPGEAITTFVAPSVDAVTDLAFAVEVSDGTLAATDVVTVRVTPGADPPPPPPPIDPPAEDDAGGCCQAGGTTDVSWLLLLALVPWLRRRRR